MGAVAMGVLVGYPYGGIIYYLLGKNAVFIGVLIMIIPVLTITVTSSLVNQVDYECIQAEKESDVNVHLITQMLTEPAVIIATGATLLSSASIAILEPTLPVLLGHTFKTPRWKIGTVFLPDSAGYFIGTCFFTTVTRYQSKLDKFITDNFLTIEKNS
ncbi:chromaffin granule amine transporter-like [Varroa destructor]|uniref:Uncharacterized protein n=1 Tax=Varroa destructor TaxID=109461 RepID=A0A7M7K902_VARDE|nr:chromaffin granule amine transporter-like [Varroa destructor]